MGSTCDVILPSRCRLLPRPAISAPLPADTAHTADATSAALALPLQTPPVPH